jgi:hypothetical protein
MPNATHHEQLQCPVCGLVVVVNVADGEAPTVEYSVAEWGKLCRHPDRGSPLLCPDLGPLIDERCRRE